jgi:hypothetical protein
VSLAALSAELCDPFPFGADDDDGEVYAPSAEADAFHATYAAQFTANAASPAPAPMMSPFKRSTAKGTPQPLRALAIRSPPLPGGGAGAGAVTAKLLLHPAWLLPHDTGADEGAAAAAAADTPAYSHRLATLRAFFPPAAPAASAEALLAYLTEPKRRFAFCLLLHQRPNRGARREAMLPPPAAGAPPHRTLATVPKAIVRVEAVYELDDVGNSF